MPVSWNANSESNLAACDACFNIDYGGVQLNTWSWGKIDYTVCCMNY